jgi:hypothetical protein
MPSGSEVCTWWSQPEIKEISKLKSFLKGDEHGIESKDSRFVPTPRNLKQQLKKERGSCTQRASKR